MFCLPKHAARFFGNQRCHMITETVIGDFRLNKSDKLYGFLFSKIYIIKNLNKI